MSILERIAARKRAEQEAGAESGLKRLEEDNFLSRVRARKNHDILTETQRVVRLPVREYAGADLTSKYRAAGGTWDLRPIQSQALAALADADGGLFSIGVGWGKTIIAFLAARALGAQYAIILVPASTAKQMARMQAEIATHFDVRPCTIVPYSKLSRAEGTRYLEQLLKDSGCADKDVVVVADEAHKLRYKTSARTKRVIRFLQAHEDVRFVAMSGTLTSKKLEDMGHLAEMALRDSSPLPRTGADLVAWGRCIDVDGEPGGADWVMVRPLWDRYNDDALYSKRGMERKAMMRKAFSKRFRSSPGVVASEQGALGCSLEIHTRRLDVPEELSRTYKQVKRSSTLPNEEPLEDDVAVWRALKQISAGFYYIWDWPGEPDYEWWDAKREWGRNVRRELSVFAEEGYDSPLLVSNRVGREAIAGSRGAIHRAWLGWMGSGLNKRKAPPTKAIWLDSFVVDDAMAWVAQQSEPVILWYQSKAMETALRERGLVVYGAGQEPPQQGHTCAMSIAAHGVGKNLQHGWSKQLVLEMPSSGKVWEQLLGRTHRPGQEADVVEVYIYEHTAAYKQAISKAVEDAKYIEDTTGSKQKLLYCTYCEPTT